LPDHTDEQLVFRGGFVEQNVGINFTNGKTKSFNNFQRKSKFLAKRCKQILDYNYIKAKITNITIAGNI